MGSQTAPPGGQRENDTTAPHRNQLWAVKQRPRVDKHGMTPQRPLVVDTVTPPRRHCCLFWAIWGRFGPFLGPFGVIWGVLGSLGGLTQLMQGAERQLHLMGTPPFQDPQQRPQNRPELWGHRRSCNTTGPHWGPPPFRDHHPNYRNPPHSPLGTPPYPILDTPQPHIGPPPHFRDPPPTPYWGPPPY